MKQRIAIVGAMCVALAGCGNDPGGWGRAFSDGASQAMGDLQRQQANFDAIEREVYGPSVSPYSDYDSGAGSDYATYDTDDDDYVASASSSGGSSSAGTSGAAGTAGESPGLHLTACQHGQVDPPSGSIVGPITWDCGGPFKTEAEARAEMQTRVAARRKYEADEAERKRQREEARRAAANAPRPPLKCGPQATTCEK